MSLFQYKSYTPTQSLTLLTTAQTLASFSATYKPQKGVDPYGFNVQASQNSPIELAEQWRELAPAELGLSDSAVDKQGFYSFASPLTQNRLGGPQAKIFGRFDEQNQLVKVAISFAGTNSLVDIPDYFQLNAGKIAPNFEPLLQAVRQYVEAQGLGAEQVLITGYSLGGGYTNIMAQYREQLLDGFFAQADYIAFASPLIFADKAIFNFGFENDIVFRILGNPLEQQTALEALKYNKFGLNNPDGEFSSSPDNIILYNGSYASYLWAYPLFSIANPFAWATHVDGLTSDAIERIARSPFCDLMQQDSTIVVSNLSKLGRKLHWVGYNQSFVADHHNQASFVIGSEHNDKLKGGKLASFLAGLAGDDAIKIGQGDDRIDGGEGLDTLWLSGRAKDWQAFGLSDGTLFFANQTSPQLIQAQNIEQISFEGEWLSHSRPYSISPDTITDNRFKLFSQANKNLEYQAHIEGSEQDEVLTGQVVFAQGGNDYLFSTLDNALLHGGEGQDWLYSEGKNARLYGAEGNDVLHSRGSGSQLSGGLGDDLFIFDQAGRYVIRDFNLGAGEEDSLLFSGDLFEQQPWQDHARQARQNVKLEYGDFQLVLENTQLEVVLNSEVLVV